MVTVSAGTVPEWNCSEERCPGVASKSDHHLAEHGRNERQFAVPLFH